MIVEIYRMNSGASRHLAIRSVRDCVSPDLTDLEAAAIVDNIIAHNDVDASAANARRGKFTVQVKDHVSSTEWDTFKRLFDVYSEQSDLLRLWKVTVSTEVGSSTAKRNREFTRLILASTFQLAHDYGKMGMSGVTNSWAIEVQGPFEEGQVLSETEVK